MHSAGAGLAPSVANSPTKVKTVSNTIGWDEHRFPLETTENGLPIENLQNDRNVFRFAGALRPDIGNRKFFDAPSDSDSRQATEAAPSVVKLAKKGGGSIFRETPNTWSALRSWDECYVGQCDCKPTHYE